MKPCVLSIVCFFFPMVAALAEIGVVPNRHNLLAERPEGACCLDAELTAGLGAKPPDEAGETKRLIALVKQTKDEEVLVEAVETLGERRSREAVPLLIDLLGDPATRVRAAAAKALGQIGDRRALDPLLKRLKAEAESAALTAIAGALAELGGREAVDGLLWAMDTGGNLTLKQASPVVRIAARDGLAKIGEPAAVEPLISILKTHESDDARHHAAVTLGRLGDERAIDPLLHALEHDDGRFVAHAAGVALGQFNLPRLVPKMKALLGGHEKERVRFAASNGLAAMNHEAAVRALIEVLEAKQPSGYTAAGDLARSSHPDAAEYLLKTLKNDEADADIRNWCVKVARVTKDARLLEALWKLAVDARSAQLRYNAVIALAGAGDARGRQLIVEALPGEPNAKRRQQYVAALWGYVRNDRSVLDAVLQVLVEDESVNVRSWAVDAAGTVQARELLPAAIEALLKTVAQDPDPSVRAKAARLVGFHMTTWYDPLWLQIKDGLIDCLPGEPDVGVRKSIAQRLVWIAGCKFHLSEYDVMQAQLAALLAQEQDPTVFTALQQCANSLSRRIKRLKESPATLDRYLDFLANTAGRERMNRLRTLRGVRDDMEQAEFTAQQIGHVVARLKAMAAGEADVEIRQGIENIIQKVTAGQQFPEHGAAPPDRVE